MWLEGILWDMVDVVGGYLMGCGGCGWRASYGIWLMWLDGILWDVVDVVGGHLMGYG